MFLPATHRRLLFPQWNGFCTPRFFRSSRWCAFNNCGVFSSTRVSTRTFSRPSCSAFLSSACRETTDPQHSMSHCTLKREALLLAININRKLAPFGYGIWLVTRKTRVRSQSLRCARGKGLHVTEIIRSSPLPRQ